MKLPRDLPGAKLVRILEKQGYEAVRQTGSHVRLVHPGPPKHSVTVPIHTRLKVGTLNAILNEVAANLEKSKEDILKG